MKKPLSAAPTRLQRMMLRLQKYDLNVRHKPGKEIPVTETLSRLHLTDTEEMLKRIHVGQMAIVKYKNRAKELIF